MKEYPYGVWQDDYHGDLHIKDITKEYLENKCVKIESPEHSEFVQKLAFKAGYSWNAGKNVAFTDKEYLFFSGTQITWFWNNENSTEEIQLPMPPKEGLAKKFDYEKLTKGYLKNYRVKIESQEHLEFLYKIAEANGIPVDTEECVFDTEYPYFTMANGIATQVGPYWFDFENRIPLTIPLQPVIGEKALAPSDDNGSVTTVTVAYFDTNNCGTDIALVFSDKKPFWVAKEDLKPLSKEDIILEEVINLLEDANGLGTKVTAMGLVEKFNIEMKGEL